MNTLTLFQAYVLARRRCKFCWGRRARRYTRQVARFEAAIERRLEAALNADRKEPK